MIQAILFDNDGTLVDTEGLFFEACSEILGRHDVHLDVGWYGDNVMKHHRSIFVLLDPARYSKEAIVELREERNRIYQGKLGGFITPLPGALGVLDYLKAKYTLGLVTSTEQRHLDMILKRVPLAPYFQTVVTCDDVDNMKPHPEPYLKAALQLGVDPKACVVIEDSERGVRAAKAAGMTCYAIPSIFARGNDFSMADGVLGGIGELVGIL